MSFPAVTVRQIGPANVHSVNARDLHTFLGVSTAFKDWIARRIADFDFADGEDFCSFLGESSGGRPSREYALSIDMAKELAMVERSAKGKQVRQYFIECERRAKAAVPTLPDFSNPSTLKSLLLQSLDAQIELRAKVEDLSPKAAIAERFAAAAGDEVPTEAAKGLKFKPGKIFSLLEELGWIYRRGRRWIGTEKALDRKYVSHEETPRKTEFGDVIDLQVMITPKGRYRLAEILNERGLVPASQAQAANSDLFGGLQ